VPGKVGWSYVVRYEPRGRPVKYIVLEEGYNEEDQQDDAREQVDVSVEEVEDIIDDDVHNNDIDDDVMNDVINDSVIYNDIIDDFSTTDNPFNDSVYDDIHIQLDEE
jgi:hypothetical protein